MARGGYRPGSGPKKGTKYKPRKSKAVDEVKSKLPKAKKEAIKEEKPSVVSSEGEKKEKENKDPLSYMLDVMNNPEVDKDRRDRMAIAAAPYVHTRKGEGKGKKEEKEDRAKSAGKGKFAPAPAPLKVVK